jgi:hypothetical protein
MDERKKTIRELENRKRETREKLAQLLKSWGETLLSRLDAEDSDRFAGELGQYRHFLETIALCRGRIRTLEEDTLRLRELETALEEKNKGAAEATGSLKALYVSLGKTALHNAPEVEASLKAQAETLTARIGVWQEKLGELEERKNAGFFSWIGNNTRGAVIRARISKTQAGLSGIYRSAGEQFFAALDQQGDIPAGDIPAQIRALRQDLALLDESRSSLQDEWEAVKESLGIKGNSRHFSPAKKIREQEQAIDREQERLADFCAAFGAQLCERFADTQEEAGENAWLEEEDADVLKQARELQEQIAGHTRDIEKLTASLQIDAERDAIDKMKKSILSHRQRIAAGESAIADLEKQIEESNLHIEELMKI